jgi:hypothetical protein
MSIFQSIAAARVVYILGIVNLGMGALVLFTCRCIPTWQLSKNMMKYKWYQRVYKLHCYLWWVLLASVIIHAVFAIIYFGVPF